MSQMWYVSWFMLLHRICHATVSTTSNSRFLIFLFFCCFRLFSIFCFIYSHRFLFQVTLSKKSSSRNRNKNAEFRMDESRFNTIESRPPIFRFDVEQCFSGLWKNPCVKCQWFVVWKWNGRTKIVHFGLIFSPIHWRFQWRVTMY